MLVGAGAGGVEMAFACRASLPSVVPIKLVGPTLLPGLNRRAKKLVGKAMREKRIEYIAQRVTSASETQQRVSHHLDRWIRRGSVSAALGYRCSRP